MGNKIVSRSQFIVIKIHTITHTQNLFIDIATKNITKKLYIKNSIFTKSSIKHKLNNFGISIPEHQFDDLTDNIYRLFYTKEYLQTNQLTSFPGVCNIILMYIRSHRTRQAFKYDTEHSADLNSVFPEFKFPLDGLLDIVWK